jgi:hypothetical protein
MMRAEKAYKIGYENYKKSLGKEADKSGVDVLFKGMVEHVRNRLSYHYNTGKYRYDDDGVRKQTLKYLKASKKTLLANPIRIPFEMLSNVVRSVGSMAKVNTKDYKRAMKFKDSWDEIISSVMGEKYFTQYKQELGTELYTGKIARAGEKAADWIVTFADTTVGRPMFVTKFDQLFMELTGERFDPAKYKSSTDYRVKHGDAIEQSSLFALRHIEELFNAKNPLSSAMRATFIGDSARELKSKTWVQFFDYLQSFNRNEYNQLFDSVRKIRFAPDKETRWQAKRDIASVVVSNMMYNVLRAFGGVWIKQQIDDILDNPEDEYLTERLQRFEEIGYWGRMAKTSSIGMALGGSSNFAKPFIAWSMYVLGDDGVQKRIGWSKEEAEMVMSQIENDYYVSRITRGGSTRQILESALPIPSVITGDALDMIDNITFVASAIDDNVDSETKKLAGIHAALTILKYKFVNPFFYPAQKQIKREQRVHQKELKENKSGTGSATDYDITKW